jgi:hypothetical protein
MGNSLHNKIYLGRKSLLASRRLRALFAVTVSVGLAWMTFRRSK